MSNHAHPSNLLPTLTVVLLAALDAGERVINASDFNPQLHALVGDSEGYEPPPRQLTAEDMKKALAEAEGALERLRDRAVLAESQLTAVLAERIEDTERAARQLDALRATADATEQRAIRAEVALQQAEAELASFKASTVTVLATATEGVSLPANVPTATSGSTVAPKSRRQAGA